MVLILSYLSLQKYNYTVPPLISTIQPLPIVIGSDIEMVCVVTGVDPPDNIAWTFNSMVVYYDNGTRGSNFTLTVTESDYGEYTCTASNQFGVGVSSIQIIQAGSYYIQFG